MSQEAIQEVLRKAVKDETFRQQMFVAPDKALAEFDLTETEMAGLKKVSPEDLSGLSLEELDERLSKGSSGDWTGVVIW